MGRSKSPASATPSNRLPRRPWPRKSRISSGAASCCANPRRPRPTCTPPGLELSHLEDHLRRLRERADQLHHAAEALENAGSKAARQDDDELKQLKQQIALSEKELDTVKKKATGKPASYSIVPYVGPNQTNRRPIYLECREEGIVLEPEGIVFTDNDFGGPLGPGNPVAAAVRAAHEYMAASDPNSLDQVEPYPLLIVRPNAIAQYYAARMALQSFGSQFGYELLGADKVLKFPDPDPQLAEKLKLVVAEARIRQQQMIAAAPSQYRHRRKPNFSVKPGGGGIQQEPDPSGGSGQNAPNPYLGIQTGRRGGAGGGGGQGGTGAGGNGPGGPGGSAAAIATAGAAGTGNAPGGVNPYPGGSGTGFGSGNTGGFGGPGALADPMPTATPAGPTVAAQAAPMVPAALGPMAPAARRTAPAAPIPQVVAVAAVCRMAKTVRAVRSDPTDNRSELIQEADIRRVETCLPATCPAEQMAMAPQWPRLAVTASAPARGRSQWHGGGRGGRHTGRSAERDRLGPGQQRNHGGRRRAESIGARRTDGLRRHRRRNGRRTQRRPGCRSESRRHARWWPRQRRRQGWRRQRRKIARHGRAGRHRSGGIECRPHRPGRQQPEPIRR